MQLADFLSGTRGQIVSLIRGGVATVAEIAAELNVTPNNVRAHLTSLESAGIVEVSGRRRGIRKPSHLYRITPAAEALYARAYEPVLIELVRALSGENLTPAFTEVGRRISASLGSMDGWPLEQKLEAVAGALRALGGSPSLEITDGIALISSRRCPLADLVATCPDACAIGVAIVASATGLAVEQQCIQGLEPQCRFVAALPPGLARA